jgi:hypothetical protein
MAFPRRQFLHGGAALLGLSALPRLAYAQLYPSRPITLVVPFPAGGPPGICPRAAPSRGCIGDGCNRHALAPPLPASSRRLC